MKNTVKIMPSKIIIVFFRKCLVRRLQLLLNKQLIFNLLKNVLKSTLVEID